MFFISIHIGIAKHISGFFFPGEAMRTLTGGIYEEKWMPAQLPKGSFNLSVNIQLNWKGWHVKYSVLTLTF